LTYAIESLMRYTYGVPLAGGLLSDIVSTVGANTMSNAIDYVM
jgi:hypothetical protein